MLSPENGQTKRGCAGASPRLALAIPTLALSKSGSGSRPQLASSQPAGASSPFVLFRIIRISATSIPPKAGERQFLGRIFPDFPLQEENFQQIHKNPSFFTSRGFFRGRILCYNGRRAIIGANRGVMILSRGKAHLPHHKVVILRACPWKAVPGFFRPPQKSPQSDYSNVSPVHMGGGLDLTKGEF